MAQLEILTEGHPLLRQKALPVKKITKRLLKLAGDMEETMRAASGVGLAAPQVGVGVRLIVLDVGEGPIVVFNPEIIDRDGQDVDVEGCLSIPGVNGYVERSAWVKVAGLDAKGKPLVIEGTDLLARALQHEIDHLDGVLFTDKATSIVAVEEEEKADESGVPRHT
ncbi:MAG: peptide deformylase [Firmicutes bacterium]|nr:peptide deformylase [Bacillota bacterium]